MTLDSERAARQIVEGVNAKAEPLGAHPQLGPRRYDLDPSYRMLLHSPFLLFCRMIPDTDACPVDRVEMVSVVDGRATLRPCSGRGRGVNLRFAMLLARIRGAADT